MGIFDINQTHHLLKANLPRPRIDADVPIIKDASEKLIGQTNDAVENMLYAYFGSVENAEKYGKDYVLEYENYDIETSTDEFSLSIKMRMTQKVRLRLKTQKELEADGQV